MSLRPFMSYYGGKWRMAQHYPPPKYDVIFEPFAGSAGYATRYPDRDVVLCDLDPVICGVWDYLIHASEEEILAIPDVPPEGTVDDLHVPQEARWLVGFWLHAASHHAPTKRPSKWARLSADDPQRGGIYWGPRVRERIASQVHAIRHWRILNVSYAEIAPSTPATWFVDPPYQVKGTGYRHGSRSIDFEHLGAWCRSLPGQVMVCENEGATWLPFTHFRDIVGTRGRRSTEVLWCREGPREQLAPCDDTERRVAAERARAQEEPVEDDVTCSTCGGTGRGPASDIGRSCRVCGGRGTVPR